MKRRDFISNTAVAGVILATSPGSSLTYKTNTNENKLTPPTKGRIPVAVAISEGATMIDFAGPWEVFQDVWIQSRGKDMDDQMPFQLFTVA